MTRRRTCRPSRKTPDCFRSASGSNGIAIKRAAPSVTRRSIRGESPLRNSTPAGGSSGNPPDARSTLPDKTDVAGVADLKRYLAEDRIDQVAFSVLKHLATYATGRSLTYRELEH